MKKYDSTVRALQATIFHLLQTAADVSFEYIGMLYMCSRMEGEIPLRHSEDLAALARNTKHIWGCISDANFAYTTMTGREDHSVRVMHSMFRQKLDDQIVGNLRGPYM